MVFFSNYNEKYWKLLRKRPFPYTGVANAHVAKHRHSIVSYYFDLQSCLHNCSRIACWVCGNPLERFVVKVVKMCSFGFVKIACNDVQLSIIFVRNQEGYVFLRFTLLHVAFTLIKKFAWTYALWLCSKVMSKSIDILSMKIAWTLYWQIQLIELSHR